jgi:hypothetical protein
MIASGCAIAWKGEVMRSRDRERAKHSDIEIFVKPPNQSPECFAPTHYYCFTALLDALLHFQ